VRLQSLSKVAYLTSCLSLGCGGEPSSPAAGGGAGSPATAGGSASGSPNTGGNGQGAQAGSPGGGNGSAGGGSGGAAGGSAGAAGASGAASAGISCTPGTAGDGTHQQPGPYTAPPEALVKEGVPKGALSPLTTLASTIYAGHEFAYQVYVPAQYQQGRRAAFMMVQDGPSHYLGKTEAKFFTNVVLDNLIAEGTIPVTVAIFVDVCKNGCEEQRRDIYDDASDKYARFVAEELLPSVIDGKYSIVAEPEGRLTVGFSAGAAQGFTVAWNRPELFRRFIGHNTSFPAAKDHGVDYVALVPQTPNKGLRVALVSGTQDLSDDRGNWLEFSENMTAALTAKGYPVRFMSGTGGHYPPDQAAMDFPNALRWTWQGCRLADY
jgi:enterochelin esterase-like enzyme